MLSRGIGNGQGVVRTVRVPKLAQTKPQVSMTPNGGSDPMSQSHPTRQRHGHEEICPSCRRGKPLFYALLIVKGSTHFENILSVLRF